MMLPGADESRDEPVGARAEKNDESAAPQGETSAQETAERGLGLAAEAVAFIDALFDYLASRLHLEGYRIKAAGRSIVAKAILAVAALGVAFFGLAFLSFGIAIGLSELIGRRWAGPMIVGGAYLLAALIMALVARRKGKE